MKRKSLFRWIPFRLAALVAPLIAAWPQKAQAVAGDWTAVGTATAGTYSWANLANWDPATVLPGGSGLPFTFNAAFLAANNFQLDGDRTMGSLTISPNVTFGSNIVGNGTGGYLIFSSTTGAALNFTSINATPGLNSIFAPIRLNSNLEVSSSIGGAQSLRGSVTGAGGLTFDSNGTHGAGVTNVLGDFALSGVNSYSGGTTITEARVTSGSNWAFGTGAVTVNNGGGIYMPGGGTFANNFTLTGQGWNESAGLLGAIRMDGNSIFNGTTTLAVSGATPVRINSHGAATGIFNGQITGTANVEFTNSAAITNNFALTSNANNWSGTTRIGRATAATGTTNLLVGNFGNSGVLGGTADVLVDVGGVLQFARSNALTVANNIAAGAGNIAQVGLGTTTLQGASDLHTGTTVVSGLFSKLAYNPGGTGGALTLSGTPGNVTLSNFADIEYNTSSNISATSGTSSITGARGAYIIQSGAGTTTLAGTVDNGSARAIVNAGTLVLGKTSAGGFRSLGAAYVQNGLVLNGGTVQLAGSGGDQIFDQSSIRINGGTFDLAGQSEAVGTVTGGTAGVQNFTNSAVAAGTITFGGASIQGGGTIGTPYGVFFDNNTIGGSTTLHAPVYAGVIANGGGGGVVNIGKADTGLQILSGASTFTGTTSIAAGTLSITGSLPAAGAVNLTAGTANLAGTGSVGNVTTTAAGGSIRPGTTGYDNEAPGATLTMASLTANGGALVVGVGAATDLINVTGNATLPVAGPPSLNPLISAPLALGNYTVLTAGGVLTVPTLPTLVGLPLTTRSIYGVAQVGNNLDLTVGGAAAQSHSWAAPGTAGTWDANVTNAWTSTDNRFFNLDAVTLGGAAANTAVTLNSVVTPAGITDNSTAGGYTISGTGGIAGYGTLTKSGTSTLTLTTNNNQAGNAFSGDVQITGGTLLTGNGGALGNAVGQTYVSGGGTLDIGGQNLGAEIVSISGTGAGAGAIINSGNAQQQALRFVRLTADASVGGNGARWDIRQPAANGGEFLDLAGNTLTKTGTGEFHLVGVNVTDGNMIADSGILAIETTSLVQGTGTITYNGGVGTNTTAAFYQNPNGSVTRSMVMNGTLGPVTVESYGQNNTVNSPVSASGAIILQGTGGTHIFGGAFTESAATSLTKNSTSTYNFAGNVNYTGNTVVNQGTLTLGGLNTASSSAVNTVTAGGALAIASSLGTAPSTFNGGTQGNLNFGGGGYTTIGAAPGLLTINNGTLAINTRSNTAYGGSVTNFFNGGTNQITITGQEQTTTIGLTGAMVGNTTQYGVLALAGGTTTVGAGTALNLRSISMTAQNANTAGANMATLNITGGDHKVASVYLGDAANTGSILNMSGGTLTFEQNGNASLQSTNNSGVAVGGVSGLRVGSLTSGNAPGSIVNLSGGTIDASKVTVSVGFDGAGFLNVTGGTLQARTLIVDNNGASPLPIINRVDLSGGGRIEIGHGGMPTQGGSSAINSGDGTWAAVESSDWTRGMSLNATGASTTTFDTGTNRVLMTGQLAGAGNLTKDGSGILVLGAPQVAATLTTTAGGASVTNAAGTLLPGMLIINANVPGGAYIASVTNGTTFTLNSGTGVLAGTAIAATEILPNIQTGAVTVNAGTVRLNNMLALGDSSAFNFATASTLDVNGFNNTALSPAIAVRPTSITLGGAGQPGTLGGLINSSGTTGGIAVDNGGTINMPTNTTLYTVGRLELGGNIGGAGFNNTISGGASTLTKNGQGQFIWRGAAASSVGNIVVNGGHFYAEENNNNLGGTGSITANRGGMISAWQSGGVTSQNKPVILNGGAILADVTSTWSGGLTLTADSKLMRNSANASVLNFTGTGLDLGGFTLTKRDRASTTGVGVGALTFSNNTSSGNGSFDIHTGTVNLGAGSTWGGTGEIKVRTDALVNLDATAVVAKAVNLAGGIISDTSATARTLALSTTGSGYVRTINAGGSMNLGTVGLAGSSTSAKTAGVMFGSGVGYTANGVPGTAMGAITLTNNSLLANNPNFTVSSNPFVTTGNDTTFARYSGGQVTGVAPTQATILGSGATDLPMVVANETVAANQTISNLITDATVTLNAGVTLTLANGGVILREVGTAGWNGAGALTSGRRDGVLGLTMTNAFTSALVLGGADVGGFTVGNISNNPVSVTPAAFRPVTTVINGYGNMTSSVANQAYTGGTYINGGRVNQQNANALGLGPITIREGGTMLVNASLGLSNNFSAAGLGAHEGGGYLFGAMRFGGGSGMGNATGTISLDSPVVRFMATDNTSILGNVTGPASNTLQRAGGGNLFIRSSLGFNGPMQLGIDGLGGSGGTTTVFNLANGGTASGIGASSNAASNLLFQSGTLSYIGGGASTDRLFTVAPVMTNTASAIAIANNGYGNLAFTNPGAVVMDNGAADVTLTLTANNYTANTFTPTLANPTGARLNISVNGPGSWELNGSSYGIGGAVAVSGGADLILNTAANVTVPVLSGGGRSYLVQNGSGTLTLGGAGLLAEADNVSGQIIVNAGTVVFDKRGPNGYASGAIVGAGTGARISALGANGINAGDGLVLNGGTVRYATTANMDQIFDNVDVRINGGTLDFNGRSDAMDSLNGTGGTITNGLAGSLSQLGVGNAGSLQSGLNFTARASYGGTITDGAGQIELIKIGNGVQELTGTNTYTGKTSIAAGLIRISSEANLGANPATFDLSHLILGGGGLESSANVTIDDANRGIWVERASPLRPDVGTNLTLATSVAGPGNLDVVGQGTVTLAGANIYTGGTSLYRGTLALDYSTQNNSKLADGAVLTLRGGNLVMSGGTHVETVSATTVDGGGANTGASYISNAGGRTAAINLNAITRGLNNGGTLDLGANGTATTDSTNGASGILISAGASGFTGTAYATVGKTNWAINDTNAANADRPIVGYAAYTAASHHDAAAGVSTPGTVNTLRLNQAAGSTINGATVLNQQGILMTPNAGASVINGTLTGFAGQTAAVTTDLVIHQHSANDLTINAVISNTTAGTFVNTTQLTKSGAGKLILTAANTALGTTYINEGTLELQGAGQVGNNTTGNAIWIDGTFSLNRAGAYSINNNMGGAATGLILKKDNTGIATLTDGIGTYAGGATVSQGALVFTGQAFDNSSVPNEANPANTVYGTITLGDAGTGATDNVIFSDGGGVSRNIRKNIVVANTGSTGLAIIGAGTVTNAATGTGASKGAFNTIHQGTVQLNRATTFRANTGDRLTFQGAISGGLGGGALTIDAPDIAGVVINSNPGRVTMEATNTFVGNVIVNGAILQVGTGAIGDPQDQIPDASNVTLNGVSAAKQAGLTLNGDSETINNLNGDVNTFLQAAGAGNATMTRLTVNGTGTFSGLFHGSNNGGMTLEKAGSGMFTLGGTADNNAGRVLVTSGTLQFAKTSSGSVHAIGADSVIQGGTLLLGGTGGDQIFDSIGLTMYGGTFDLGGTNETVQNIFSNPGVGTITNSGGAASTLTLGGNQGSSLLGATIQNGTSALALGKVNNGGVVLTGTNTYTGATTIANDGGYIQLGNGGTTGSIASSSAVSLGNNTQIVFNRTDNVAFANTVTGTGGLVLNGTGIVEIPLGTTDLYTGPTVVNAGELKVNGSASASAVTLNPGTILSGSGTVGAVGSRGGSIRPGNSPGIITTGSVIVDTDTSFHFEVNGIVAGTSHDQINTSGIIDITDSTLVLTIGYTPVNGDKVFPWLNDSTDAITGNWFGLPEGSTIGTPSDYWILSYNDDSLGNPSGPTNNLGNDVSLYYVPEPSTTVLGGAAALLALGRRRRKVA